MTIFFKARDLLLQGKLQIKNGWKVVRSKKRSSFRIAWRILTNSNITAKTQKRSRRLFLANQSCQVQKFNSKFLRAGTSFWVIPKFWTTKLCCPDCATELAKLRPISERPAVVSNILQDFYYNYKFKETPYSMEHTNTASAHNLSIKILAQKKQKYQINFLLCLTGVQSLNLRLQTLQRGPDFRRPVGTAVSKLLVQKLQTTKDLKEQQIRENSADIFQGDICFISMPCDHCSVKSVQFR